MCVNAPVSFIAFVVGAVFSILLLLTFNDNLVIVALALFFLFVVLVQLFEGMTHLGYNGSHAILVLTTLQPVVLGVLLLYATSADPTYKMICGAIIVFYIGYMFYMLNQTPAFNSLTPAPGCKQLQYTFWSDVGSLPYFLVALVIAALLITPSDIALVFIVVVAITLGIALCIYSCGTSAPSMWCLTAVAAPIVLYLYMLWRESHVEEKVSCAHAR